LGPGNEARKHDGILFGNKESMDESSFTNRSEAGRALAEELKMYAGTPELLVLGLPRGGVPVAYEVAMALNGELDVFVVRKLGVPYQPELAMGAIASGGITVLNDSIIAGLDISRGAVEAVIRSEKEEIIRREHLYRGNRPPLHTANRIVILVDDGLATGATMKAAALALTKKKPARLIVAVPVASPDACAELEELVDEVVCLRTPEPFYAVGYWYHDFRQTSDKEIEDLMAKAAERQLQTQSGG